MTRRQALAALGLGAVPCAMGCMRQLSYAAEKRGGVVRVPRAELGELTASSDALIVSVEGGAPIAVRTSGRGYRALVASCTHRGCALRAAPDGYDCTCHGSRFDLGGSVLNGPASEPLTELRTRLEADALFILEGALPSPLWGPV